MTTPSRRSRPVQPHDQTLPRAAWKFDGAVTAVFDDMLARSIPQYEVMRRAVADLALRYVQPDTEVLDLGCSRGEGIARLLPRFPVTARCIGVDNSPAMVKVCRERFAAEIRAGAVLVQEMDLSTHFPVSTPSVVMAVLTLQFVPLERRQQVVATAYRRLTAGGVLLLVEKVLGADAATDQMMVDLYLALKLEHGYTHEQIEAKRKSLSGVLVPVTAAWNEDLLHKAGFRVVDCFWRWMNFAGWLARK